MTMMDMKKVFFTTEGGGGGTGFGDGGTGGDADADADGDGEVEGSTSRAGFKFGFRSMSEDCVDSIPSRGTADCLR
jgi:hypothetical protein